MALNAAHALHVVLHAREANSSSHPTLRPDTLPLLVPNPRGVANTLPLWPTLDTHTAAAMLDENDDSSSPAVPTKRDRRLDWWSHDVRRNHSQIHAVLIACFMF